MSSKMRIQKELKYFEENSSSYECIKLLGVCPNLQSATFAISGPIDSPYEGFWFRIFVQWSNYPYGPPKFTLLDKIWNPYVDFDKNQFCVDIIKQNFSPALTTPKIILSIISLLGESKIGSEHQGFANPKAAAQMINNYPYFCNQAKKACQSYSYKKQSIYRDQQRGIPQEHFIKAQGKDLEELVDSQSKNPQMQKNPDKKKNCGDEV